jgi:hypothetical protein
MDTDQSDFCYEATYDDNGNMCWYVRYNSVDYRLYAPGAFPDYNVIFPDFDIEEFDGDDYDTSYNEPRWGGVINPFDPSKGETYWHSKCKIFQEICGVLREIILITIS